MNGQLTQTCPRYITAQLCMWDETDTCSTYGRPQTTDSRWHRVYSFTVTVCHCHVFSFYSLINQPTNQLPLIIKLNSQKSNLQLRLHYIVFESSCRCQEQVASDFVLQSRMAQGSLLSQLCKMNVGKAYLRAMLNSNQYLTVRLPRTRC